MKKIILFITAILIGLTSFAQMGSIPVSPGYGSLKAAEFQKRTIDSSATYLPNVAPHEFDVLRSYGIDPVFALFPASQSSGAVMAHIPTDGTGDGTMARNSTSYNQNYNGYLEPIAVNTLAVNYNNGIPYFETHEQRTNLITYPKSLGNSYWTKSGATIEGDASTAGSELIVSTLVNNSYTTFTGATTSAFNATSTVTSLTAGGTADEISVEEGKIYLVEFDLVLNSGTAPFVSIKAFPSSGGNISNLETSVSGSNSFQLTATSTQVGAVMFSNTSLTDFEITNLSVKEVTGYSTPLLDAGTPTTEAYKLVEDGTTGNHYIANTSPVTVTNGSDYSLSIYVKYGGKQWIYFLEGYTGKGFYYDVLNNVIGTSTFSPNSVSSEEIVDGWYKLSVNITTASTNANISVYLAEADNDASYTGDGTSGVYLCYPQLEEGSYASPLMLPSTEGSTTTRLADAVTGFGDAATFANVNSSGVLIWKGISYTQTWTGNSRTISINDGTVDNRIILYWQNNGEITVFNSVAGSSDVLLEYTVSDITVEHTYAVRWAENDYSLWVDGVEVASDEVSASVFPASTLTNLSFDNGSTNNFYGKIQEIIISEYLTDTQMATLK